MNHSNHILNDLNCATRDGQSFYEHAATKVDSPELKALFTRLAKVKGEIVHGLSNEIRTGGDKPTDAGTWSGDFSKLYGDVRALLGDKCSSRARQSGIFFQPQPGDLPHCRWKKIHSDPVF